jgi:hypothetical protein
MLMKELKIKMREYGMRLVANEATEEEIDFKFYKSNMRKSRRLAKLYNIDQKHVEFYGEHLHIMIKIVLLLNELPMAIGEFPVLNHQE